MLTAEGMRRASGAALGSLPVGVRRPGRGRPVAPDLFRRLRPVAVRVPDGRVGGPARCWSRAGRRSWPTTCSGRSSTGPYVDEVVAPAWYDGKHSAPHRRGQLVDVGPRPPGVDAGATRSASSWRASPRAWSRASARPARDSRSSTSARSSGPLRRSKDPDEVAVLRRSIRAGEAAHAAALARGRAGDDRARRLPGRPERGRSRRWASRRSSTATSPRAPGARPSEGARRRRGRSSGATCSCSTSRWSSTAIGATSPTRSPSAAAPTPRQRELFEACVEAHAPRARPA